MKFTIPPQGFAADAAVRPGFDVLMAVTGARQAASPTARCVGANRPQPVGADGNGARLALLAHGRLTADTAPAHVARFAEVAAIPGTEPVVGHELATEINGLFTRAFQAMVKHPDVMPANKAGRRGDPGPGME